MEYYPILITIHIIFAGGWLINFLIEQVIKKNISIRKGSPSEKVLVGLYLKFSNLLGIIGATGILITGITMVILNPGYGFFQMTANHWLSTKQILMVILLLIIFLFIIPTAKKLRSSLSIELDDKETFTEEAYKYLNKIYRLNTIINIIVLLNFLFAITRRFLA